MADNKTALRITASQTRRLALVFLVGFGVTCALADRANAAGSAAVSDQWQLLNPFTLKVSTVTSPGLVQGVVRLRAETRVVSSSLGGSRVASTVAVSTTSDGGLRVPAVRVPYRPDYRSPFTPPGL
jgi:hypothetical protein